MPAIRKNQQGFTLIEIAIVFTIAGLIIAGIWLAVSSVIRAKKIADTKRQVGEIVANVRDYYEGRGLQPADPNNTSGSAEWDNAASEDMVRLINAGVFPAEMTCRTAMVTPSCRNVFGGTLRADMWYNPSVRRDIQLDILIIGVPRDICAELAMNYGGTLPTSQNSDSETSNGGFFGFINNFGQTQPTTQRPTFNNIGSSNICPRDPNNPNPSPTTNLGLRFNLN